MRKFVLFMMVLLLLTEPVFVLGTENGVRIAIIDTGISTEALGRDQIAKGKNYILPNQDTEDQLDHGTAIASLILGKQDRNLPGAYPEAILVPLVYVSLEGKKIVKGDAAMIAHSIYDAVDLFSCQVINLSAGILIDSKELKDACDYAEKKGVVIVSAVGNDNRISPQNIYYPAAYDTVIGAGAINSSGETASFSQRNSSVDLVANGEELLVSRASGRMTDVSGTSYACAYVSAAAAMLLSKNPELSPRDVREILFNTSKDLGIAGYDIENGHGALNMDKALEQVGGYPWFSDVSVGNWYFNSVNRISRLGLIKGTSEREFSPNLTTTKAMALSILYRMDGNPAQTGGDGKWYSNAEAWAKKNRISDCGNIEGPISREELANILWRFAAYRKMDVMIGENTDIARYHDFDAISDYAVAAMRWAVGSGVMKGNANGTLNPKGNASRAEVSTMILNYMEALDGGSSLGIGI